MQTYKILALIITTLGILSQIPSNEQGSFLSLQKSNGITPFIPEPEYRSEAQHNDLMMKIKSQSFSDGKIEVIQKEVPLIPQVFSSTQVLDILQQLLMTDDKKQALEVMEPFIYGFTTDEMIPIISSINMSSDKLDVLRLLAIDILDLTEENKERIIKIFSFSSDKKTARAILDGIPPRNPLFGNVTENVATFVIDISGSMDYTFKTDEGKTMTRLNFVKEQLSATITEQLQDYQLFNIIAFDDKVTQWKSNNVPANEENIKEALKYVSNLKSRGATNLSQALEKAFQCKEDLEGVYFLSDGAPNYGVTSVEKMGKLVEQLVSSRSPKVRIHTTSFMLGGKESSADRKSAKAFLEIMAEKSQGSFKYFNDVK